MNRKHAFTLNELLIVIAIIVLLIGLAVPAFNVLTGSKSIESATNQISAFLGQARMEAIGVQETRGVLFFLDKESDRIYMAMVRSVFKDNTGVTWLDLVPDRDFVALPAGIGFQTIDNPTFNQGTATTNDKYLGFNDPLGPAALSESAVLYGGVILFDGYGRLTTEAYGFHCTAAADASNITATGPIGVYSAMGSLFATGGVTQVGAASTQARNFTLPQWPGNTLQGQFGFALFDRDGYASSAPDTDGRDEDWQIDNSNNMTGDEVIREQWLGENALHFLVNRYNGTLVKGD